MMGDDYDVVIIGAGLSGLYAARILQKYNLKLCIVEARDRVGGRTFTERDCEHGYCDLGAGYVGPTQDRVLQLANDLDIETYDVNTKGKTILNFEYTWGRYLGTVPPFWNPIRLIDLNNIMRLLNDMAKQVPRKAPWTADKAREWDSMTVAEFLVQNCWTRAAVDSVEVFVEGILAAQSHEVSLLFLLWYINSGGGILRLSSVEDGAQEKKCVGGAQLLSEKMVQDGLSPYLYLSSPVVKIHQTADEVRVITDTGRQLQAKYVISSIPSALLNRIQFIPSLPDLKTQLIQRMPMGSIIKTVMFYDTAFWREKDLNGSAVSNHGPVSYCMDDTKPDGSNPAIMGFILADRARDLAEMTSEYRKDYLCKHYAEAFGMEEFLCPIGYLEKNWMEEEYSGGCYTSVLPPGVLSNYGRVLRKPVGRVHFAGTETATEWAGYMDGALQSGERAAGEILDQLALKWADTGRIVAITSIPDQQFVERILPSVNNVLYTLLTAAIAAFGYFIYPYFTGWRGRVLYRYLDYKYDWI